ncbi:MAG: hypothetical protein GY719_21465 [bacterium]|nr:hypothetical protein [bacterium]
MRVLIPTHVGDIHAVAVAIALREKGHEAVLWHGADYPTRQKSSIAISEEQGLRWAISGPDLELDGEPFDVVWYRRPVNPVLPEDLLHPGDRHIAQRACSAFYRSLWEVIAPDAFWVNPLTSIYRANSKPAQLAEALRSGLRVSPTLCSNDPDEIRRFLGEYEGETIYKSYMPTQWKSDDGIAQVFTTTITEDDLPDDDILQISSGIYQRRIPKEHELRVTYLGDFPVVGKLAADAEVDSRSPFGSSRFQVAEPLPEEVDRGCRELMRRLNIVFGCFDLIVTPEGEHFFVEVNEMGQFLFVEEANPEIMVLDPFCELLIHGRRDFDWQPKADSIRFRDVREETVRHMQDDGPAHVPKTFRHSADESGKKKDGVAEMETPFG